ncbi:TetR family transcriptional regulator [Saccharibacillus sp. CPCC 101409]|uniref:acyl-CoA-like ligand-binding transcription factor n=1 Tax=Saccharibacillus sp. CPCC 101409 TaxID=3058041 RepID=UPI0026713624|nr:TetR family transcriptional regulator [Saccharibacillus sp. CPCC 101409]MDO3412586.1 TetR family transcriptional regulator [Saccharibacillus sp. CPCC 101409]
MNPNESQSGGRPAASWQEQKKAKTKAVIQKEALKLFTQQGYNETTIEQIAEASAISRVTFFRYFATKADVVLADLDYIDRTVMEAALAESGDKSVIQALRRALSKLFLESPQEENEQIQARHLLLRTVPELRGAILNHSADKMRLINEMVAERAGSSADDFAVSNFSGAIAGVWMAAWTRTEEDLSDGFMDRYYRTLDAGLEHLEAGLPLSVERVEP